MDSNESHRAFASNIGGVPFPLLPDPDGRIAGLYGVDTSRGFAKRTTIVIGGDGKVFRVFADVKVTGHEAEVLASVKASTRVK